MKLTEVSVKKPVSTLVGVLLVALFGLVALKNLPIQMKPTLDKPIINIRTDYPGAAPLEVEEQITDKFEEKLNALEGLRKLSSVSSDSLSNIELEFDWGVDRDARFVDVLQKFFPREDRFPESTSGIISGDSMLMRIQPGGQRHQGRPAYWRGHVASSKDNTLRSQLVQMRGFDDVVAHKSINIPSLA